MKTGYIYINSNREKEDDNAFMLSEIQRLLTFAYKAGIIVKQIFIDFNQPDISSSKPQLSKLMQAMSVYHGQFVLVTQMSCISRSKELVRTFLACSIATNTQIVSLIEQKRRKGKNER